MATRNLGLTGSSLGHAYLRDPALRDPRALLDHVAGHLASLRVRLGMTMVWRGLSMLRREMPTDEWNDFTRNVCSAHPVRALLFEDPFTLRVWERPRGYPGDAGTLDMIYGIVTPGAETTERGRLIYGEMMGKDGTQSVRWRRDLLARCLDEVGLHRRGARVLSLACGYLREAAQSRAVVSGAIGAYLALDQDEDCIRVIESGKPSRCVTPMRRTVREVLTGRFDERDMDFVYAAGLYDYLEQPAAVALTARLFALLRSGGVLLVANFTPRFPDAAFMEAFMRWSLVYRGRREMEDLSRSIDPEAVADKQIFRDPLGNVAYLQLVRT